MPYQALQLDLILSIITTQLIQLLSLKVLVGHSQKEVLRTISLNQTAGTTMKTRIKMSFQIDIRKATLIVRLMMSRYRNTLLIEATRYQAQAMA